MLPNSLNNNRMGLNQNIPFYGNNNFLPRYEIVQVNGENGVDTFQMGPNSNTLLLDTTAPIVWLVQTDGAGYKTKIPYDITPHQTIPPVDLNQLQLRITQLEEIVNAKYQSDDKPAKSKKQQHQSTTPNTTD